MVFIVFMVLQKVMMMIILSNSQVSFSSLISSRALDSEKQGIKKAFKIVSSCLMLFRFVNYKSMENPATVSFPDSHCLLSTPLFDFPSWKILAAVLHLVSLTKTGCKGFFFFVISIIIIEIMGIVTRICNALPEMDSLCSVAFTIFGSSCIFL